MAVTQPVSGIRPALSAYKPTMEVVATDPRAPVSQRPQRFSGSGRAGTSDVVPWWSIGRSLVQKRRENLVNRACRTSFSQQMMLTPRNPYAGN
ncbi:hypothetical protein MSHI_14930 [Mycobacterium shinjukuense]|uniref:Uncharacterized protein n=1 Tax=Mycobacterium shinjukuense TaxID=398694 RepID=A0A7I7MP62_9MYCO|nr:hypothetical protein MSHI_14930 [Mycobacterium shinjukuense]